MQPEAVVDFLAGMPLFAALDRLSLEEVARIAEPFSVARGVTVFSQGQPPDGLYLLASGRFAIGVRSAGDEQMNVVRIGPGGMIGELAMLDGQPRAATVVAEDASEGLFIPLSRFQGLVSDARPAAFALVDRVRLAVAERLRVTLDAISALKRNDALAGARVRGSDLGPIDRGGGDPVPLLRSLAPFASMTDAEIAALAALGKVAAVARGQRLAEAGATAEFLYVVLRGALRTALPRGDMCEQLLVHGPGDLVGLLAVLDGAPLASELIVREDAILLMIARDSFLALRSDHREMAHKLMLAANRQLVRDLRRLTRHLGRARGLLAFNDVLGAANV